MLADEPSGNLDSANANALHQMFVDLRDNFKQTFVIVTHNDDLAKISDRVVTMKDGFII
jgi:lipoprotein-releasing system ATP-binding protein